MSNWSKSYEVYLSMSDKQRLSVGLKADAILSKEICELIEDPLIRPSFYLVTLSQFISLREGVAKDEYRFVKEVIRFDGNYEKFVSLVEKGKNEKLNSFLVTYFQKVGGEVLTAYLSLALAILTIKGELLDEEKKLIESIQA